MFRYYYQSASPAATTYESLVLALGPEGYWPMDDSSGNLADATGNGWTATVSGSPSYSQTGPTINGVAQSAVDFATTSDYATVSEAIDDGITTSDGMTISAWVNLDGAAAGYIVSKFGPDDSWALYRSAGASVNMYAYQDDGSTLGRDADRHVERRDGHRVRHRRSGCRLQRGDRAL